MSGSVGCAGVSEGGATRRGRASPEVIAHRTGLAGVEAMTLGSARRFPRHSHDDYGVGLMAFGGHQSWSGSGPVEALPGDMITVNPGEIHDGAPMRGETRGWRMIYLRPAILADAADEEGTGPFEFARPSFRDSQVAWRFARLFRALAGPASERLAVEEQLAQLIGPLICEHGARPPRPPKTPPPIAKVLERLNDAPSANVTLADLAAIAGTSRFQLVRAFSRRLGVTPHAYLVQRRVCLARALLRAGRTPVEAAGEAGFSDQSHMTRAFAGCYGVTPARFRAAVALT